MKTNSIGVELPNQCQPKTFHLSNELEDTFSLEASIVHLTNQ